MACLVYRVKDGRAHRAPDTFDDQRESNGPLIGLQEHYRHGLAALVEDFSKVGRIASIMASS
jgi:hypothetical protein